MALAGVRIAESGTVVPVAVEEDAVSHETHEDEMGRTVAAVEEEEEAVADGLRIPKSNF